MKRLVPLLLLTGCTNIPQEKKFWEIYNEPYILNKNDCSNKTAEYVRFCRSKGIDADAMSLKDGFKYHALARIKNKDKFVYVDVTQAKVYDSVKNARVVSEWEFEKGIEWSSRKERSAGE